MKTAQVAASFAELLYALGGNVSPLLFSRMSPAARQKFTSGFQQYMEQKRQEAAQTAYQERMNVPQTDEELFERLVEFAQANPAPGLDLTQIGSL